ncbi:D-alanyl-D-alanine dipeptidase [Agarivorans sp. B2Z047]|uniref:M15 family metallopeptidase n=1 Tax=Agarivorans sp. B2Z047 TaxID=2652721 RepID=UPI00128C2E47|nr:M15 family metallopeptidase [Agarivorans sp. B2Z047]MPW29199.1 D-alanyl-D-alanine dipeptidase [Agarivorans sp. B2Z047]UQN41752.1 M15 family metallopeptidase [Agarivorans sp. B2Z047]
MIEQHTDISASQVVNIPIIDNQEALTSADGYILCGPPPESLQTQCNYKRLRRQVLKKLLDVDASLPSGLRLRLYEAYRSPGFQQQLFNQHMQDIIEIEPNLTMKNSYQRTAQLVAPSRSFDGKPLCPPHSTGGAVDIEIVDKQGKVIDFGMEIQDWRTVPSKLCSSDYTGISSLAKTNRRLLRSAMLQAGFVNYSREWWHFSYGDQYWAYMQNKPHAIYGRIE